MLHLFPIRSLPKLSHLVLFSFYSVYTCFRPHCFHPMSSPDDQLRVFTCHILSAPSSIFGKTSFLLIFQIFTLTLKSHISISTAKTISTALISSRLDYCNSLLNNIAKRDLDKPQIVQNCLTRVVLRAPRFSPSLPLLRQLHWLPVTHRINVKLSNPTYHALSTQQPPYLASLLHLSNIPRQIRSSISQLIVPNKNLTWVNVLSLSLRLGSRMSIFPITLKTSETIAIFRKNSRHIYSKLHFHHTFSVVPRSDNVFCASLFAIMLNDSGLLRL